ncbi:MAG: hypothetical protein KVP17_004934 [Porospora cf. gigantea B]|uniref:uncharacterized protein n=1 Tax=Porospora cf. gigantea B TaxID=2853592 RepID=UPI0035717A40|nr:MAG: hypothetical protein KVP17_004934 [Porospora cf. gigantea B]
MFNEKQKSVVEAPLGSYMVVAGAGTGKTRVLTGRVAYLIRVLKAEPQSILALSFTRKAANEMKARVKAVLGGRSLRGAQICTFHSFCVRLLRREDVRLSAGIKTDWQIMDSVDQKAMVKTIISNLVNSASVVDSSSVLPILKVDEVLKFISFEKQSMRRALVGEAKMAWLLQCPTLELLKYEMLVTCYGEYERIAHDQGLLDFDELLLSVYEVLAKDPQTRGRLASIYRHILVDEFQDTNELQFRVLYLIGRASYVIAVGDDDQAIYGWRGARPENLRQFRDAWPRVQAHTLDQNYRSTKNILDKANNLIAFNRERLPKELWTENDEGEEVIVLGPQNDLQPATDRTHRSPTTTRSTNNPMDSVPQVIKRHLSQNQTWKYSDISVLYRKNKEAMALEQAMLFAKLPYIIVGGVSFFERKEIRDAMNLLRFSANPEIGRNVLKVLEAKFLGKGIGAKALQQVKQIHAGSGLTLWQACRQKIDVLAPVLAGLLRKLEALLGSLAGMAVAEQVRFLMAESGIVEHYKGVMVKEREKAIKEWKTRGFTEEQIADHLADHKLNDRMYHLDTLVRLASNYQNDLMDESLDEAPSLNGYIDSICVDNVSEGTSKDSNKISLMTIHKSKGLEFMMVVVINVVERNIPLVTRPTETLEEERRLFYVALTRGMRKVVIHCPFRSVSQFVGEMNGNETNENETNGNETNGNEASETSTPRQQRTPAVMMAQRYGIQRSVPYTFAMPLKTAVSVKPKSEVEQKPQKTAKTPRQSLLKLEESELKVLSVPGHS